MPSPTHYDVVIVGSGQCGSPLAKSFALAGRRTALIEKSHIGGCCVNEGCTPTKTMIASGRVAYLTRRAAEYGVNIGYGAGDALRVEMTKVRQRKRDIVDSFRGGGEKRLKDAGVDVLMGEAAFTGPKSLAVRMIADGKEHAISGATVILDVGERPVVPDLPGLEGIDKSRVLDSTSVMELGDVPRHLLVIGGGYIGLEFGQLFRRLGAEVTIVQRAVQLVPREDQDVAEALLGILREDKVPVHLSSRAKSISSSGDGKLPLTVQIETVSNEIIQLNGSHILLAAGRAPNTDTLGLPAAGIKTTARGHLIVDERLKTNVEGVYGIGDAHGGPAFTHMAYDDFRILRANLLPETTPATTPVMKTTRDSRSRNLVPYVMYTDPQLAHIGLHAKDLTGRKIKTAKMPMSYVARALETDETRGLMKATVDAETGEILGFTCLGIEGGEIMSIVQAAMMGGLKWWDLEAAVWAHPTLAESLNNLWGFLE